MKISKLVEEISILIDSEQFDKKFVAKVSALITLISEQEKFLGKVTPESNTLGKEMIIKK